MSLLYPAVLSALLLSIGLYGVLRRRNTILVLIGVELMLNAVTLLLVATDVALGAADPARTGQVLALFVITLAAAEIGLGLAIVLLVFRQRADIGIDRLRMLRETDGPAA
jgi:NADH-quinone oxidoreductase subunit K